MERELTNGQLLEAIQASNASIKSELQVAIQTSQAEVLETIHEFATHVDQRFDQIDIRFDQIDKRFDGLDRLLVSDGFPIVRSAAPLPRRRRR